MGNSNKRHRHKDQQGTTGRAPSKSQHAHPDLIPDRFSSYEQLQAALRSAGLESSNLIVGVDFTKSNNWTGKRTFGGHCLHECVPGRLNPYQSVITIMGQTLEVFDDDKLIPAYGFGDATTADKKVFPFFPDGRPCAGFQEVINRYTEITPRVVLAGPTSFAPIIYQALEIVKQAQSYHILLIIADGQVTSEADTVRAIVDASSFPLSIVVVGVGDGPFDMMEEFDDGLPQRKFDNFQFVDFNTVLTKYDGSELAFATMALQEIPDQFRAIRRLKLL